MLYRKILELGFNDKDDLIEDADLSDDTYETDIIDNSALAFDEQINENIEEMIRRKEDFQGFETKSLDFITEDLQQTIIDIGELGKARGKIYDPIEFSEKVFTTIKQKNKKKILELKDKDSFDTFTDKYAIGVKSKIHIDWKKVSNDYKGIYINSSVLDNRDDTIPYLNRTADNWLFYDYNRLDDVIIFHNLENIITFKRISEPFQGRIADEYAIEENQFAKINDKITFDKILLIDSVKAFDKFTNRYGLLKKDKIMIDWQKVNHDYNGFYIDKDNTFFDSRKKEAFYQGEPYKSWIRSGINKGIVYLFD